MQLRTNHILAFSEQNSNKKSAVDPNFPHADKKGTKKLSFCIVCSFLLKKYRPQAVRTNHFDKMIQVALFISQNLINLTIENATGKPPKEISEWPDRG